MLKTFLATFNVYIHYCVRILADNNLFASNVYIHFPGRHAYSHILNLRSPS